MTAADQATAKSGNGPRAERPRSPEAPSPPPRLGPLPLPTAIRWAAAALVLAGIGLCLHLLRYALLPFVAAGALTLLFSPVVRWLNRRHHWPHWLAALSATLLCAAVFAGIGWGIDVLLVPRVAEFCQRAPTQIPAELHRQFPSGRIQWAGLDIPIDNLPALLRDQLGGAATASNLAMAAGATFSAAMGLFLTLLLTAYFLFTAQQTNQQLLWLVPPSHRQQARRLAQQIVPMLRRYIVGVVGVALYAMLLTWLVTQFAMHLRGAVLIAIAVGLLEMVPILGPVLALVLVGAVVLMQHATAAGIVGFALFATALRLSIDQIIGPVVLGKSTSLPPPVIIFAFLVGGVLFGAVGVIVAVPAAAVMKIILSDVYGDDQTPSA